MVAWEATALPLGYTRSVAKLYARDQVDVKFGIDSQCYNFYMEDTNINELSDREIEILKLVATGASNKEIATKLSISPNPVKVHLRNIYKKTKVNNKMVLILTFIDYINRTYDKND